MEKIKYWLLTKSIGFYINLLRYWNPKKAALLAYKLFSNPRIGKFSEETLPLVLQDALKETVHFNEHTFQTYTWSGNETVTLLVHGWESNASRWEKLLPHLKQTGHTIVALDAPAHGLSSGKEFNVPQYAAFIDVLTQRYQPKHIIGHSIGGIASVYYQHHYPNQLKKMILLGAPSDFTILISNYVKLLGLHSKIHQFLKDYTKEKFAIAIEDFSAEKFLKSSSLPGIVAHDHNDTVVAFSEGQKLASSWKNATFIQTQGLGHSLHDDALYQKIISFLMQ